tara:strand:- start:167 stop:1930 length:1764 start_codon:yes stop_codon:yes gene_type:complete
MHNSSNKSKGYMPVSSGPNMTGFDMGKTSSMMDMMQEGGLTPMSSYQRSFTRPRTPGAALLARALQGQKDRRLLEDYQRAEAERQRKGGLFGSIGGLAGGLLGAALAPVTGGASLALASGLGTALGRRAGEGLGAGKSRSVDRTGTVFGQQSFRDVEQASRDFTRGMGERALLSGLQAAATSVFSPGGGIYGATGRAAEAGKLGTIGTRLREGASAIGKTGARLGLGSGKALTTASGELLSSGLPANIAGSALADTVLNLPAGKSFGGSLPISEADMTMDVSLLGDVAVPDFDASLPDFSDLPQAPSVSEMAYRRSLPDAVSLGEENALLDAARTAQAAQATAEEASRSAGSLIGYLERQELGPLADSLRMAPAPSMDPSLTEVVSPYFNLPMAPNRAPSMASVGVGPLTVLGGSPAYGFEDGGLIGMQTGGLTAEQILREQGLTADDKQLALFQEFDPTGIQSATQATGESLLGMTGGQGLASAGSGFGSQQRAVSQAVGQAQQDLEGQIGAEQKAFESQTLGTAADIVAGGGEFGTYGGSGTAFVPPGAPPTPEQGETFNYLGTEYEWTGTRWVQVEGPRDDRGG